MFSILVIVIYYTAQFISKLFKKPEEDALYV